MMTKISYSGYRFPPEIIQQAIWLYVRFRQAFDQCVVVERAVAVIDAGNMKCVDRLTDVRGGTLFACMGDRQKALHAPARTLL